LLKTEGKSVAAGMEKSAHEKPSGVETWDAGTAAGNMSTKLGAKGATMSGEKKGHYPSWL